MKRLRFAQIGVFLGVLLYGALGVWFLVQPDALKLVGLAAESPAARTEIRATYGGLELGLAFFLAWTLAGSRERLRAGLAAMALTTGGFALGRTCGLVLDRPAEPIFLTLLGVEVASALGACVAAKLLPPDEGPEAEAPRAHA